jgi:two-component system chemotaxis response regulator CheY
MNILVVDDLSFMRAIIRDILVAAGYTIAGEAVDGMDCLKKYEEKVPDLVLLDIAMPRMDGLTCLRELKKTPSRIYSSHVFFSGRSGENHKSNSMGRPGFCGKTLSKKPSSIGSEESSGLGIHERFI